MCKGLCSLMRSCVGLSFSIRPGSASPSGKPSGPGAPAVVVSLPGHYTQQVWLISVPNADREDTLHMANTLICCLMLQMSAPQGSMVMHMRPPTSGPFPNPIQRPVMQVNKTVIIRSPPYHSPGRDLPHSTPSSNPEPTVKGPEDGVKVSHPL